MFYVGQKVVCVDGQFPKCRAALHTSLPVVGMTYTVRGAFMWDEVGVYLEEIKSESAPWAGNREYGFYARRFRPVIERKTDISIFTAMLTPSKPKVDA